MSTQITRRYTIFGGSTLVATSLLAGEAPPPARAAELNPQPLPPSPGWARALPPGPDTRVKITEAYAKLVARDAYFWAWPLVNIFNRRQTFKDVTEIVMAGPVPTAPLNRVAMLTDYITPAQRIVACPNQDVVYGAGSLALNITPVVLQVPNFGERFWVYQVVDLRTDGVVQLGKMYGTGREDADTCCIAAGPGQRLNQSRLDHIVGTPEDRNRCCRPLCSANCSISDGINDIDLGFDKVRRKFRNQVNVQCILPPIDREILALDEAKSPQFIEHRDNSRSIAWTTGQAANAIGPPRLLRRRSERPCDTRGQECDKLAPPHSASLPHAETSFLPKW
jgi:Protein of unknown function (DUF1254)